MRPPPVAGSNGVHHEPPHDDLIERTVVGACLIHPECVPLCSTRLKPKDFYRYKHEVIFDAVLATHAKHGDSSTPLLVIEELRRRRRLDDAGGDGEVVAIFTETITAAGIEAHADTVAQAATARRLLDAARKLEEQVLAHPDTARDYARKWLDDLQLATESTDQNKKKSRSRPWTEVATDKPISWIVDGLIPEAGVIVLAGDPGAGKTLLAIDVALRLAHGMGWLGRDCKPASTLYLAGEGGSGLASRLRAWKAANSGSKPLTDCFVSVHDGVPDLTSPSAISEMEQLIVDSRAVYGRVPDIVVIDTLAMAIPGSDENDSGAIGKVMQVLSELRRRYGCTFIIIHHFRKPAGDRGKGGSSHRSSMHMVRGSTAIVGAADVVLLAVNDDGNRTLEAAKVRDGESLRAISYAIHGQDTGMVLANGKPEVGPFVSLQDPKAASAATSAKMEEDIRRLDAALLALQVSAKGRITKDLIFARAEIKRDRGWWAFAEGERRGLWVNSGTPSLHDWRKGVPVPCSLSQKRGTQGTGSTQDVPGTDGNR